MGIEQVSALTLVSTWALSLLKAQFDDKAKAHLSVLYDDHLKPIVNNVLGFSSEEEVLPVNENLGKAVIEARNFATQFLFYAYKLYQDERKAIHNIDFDYNGIDLDALTAVFGNFIFHENHVLSEDHPRLDGQAAYSQIHVLLAGCEGSKNETLKFREDMSKLLKEELLAKLYKLFGRDILPEGLEEMLWNGFSVYGKKHEWTEVFVLKFADILKEPAYRKANIAFQNRLMSDIKVDTDILREALQKQFDLMEKEFKSISKTLEKFEIWLILILGKVTTMQTDVNALKSRLEVISENLAFLTDKTISSSKDKTYPRYLNDVAFCGSKFLGRKSELAQLDQMVPLSEPTVISGLSGVGKTMILEAYLKNVAPNYDHILWVNGPGFEKEGARGIFESFKQIIISDQSLTHFGLQLTGLKNYSPEMRYKLILQELRNIKGKNLYVVDNISTAFSQEMHRLEIMPHWDTIFVSRAEPSDAKWLAIQKLENNDAIEIFSFWYKPDEKQLAELVVLIESLHNHPLLIELAAKTIAKSFGRLGISEFNALLESNSIDQSRYVHAIQFLDQNAKILDHINHAFPINSLSSSKKNIILNLYFLRDAKYSDEELSAYMDIVDDEYEAFHADLFELVEQGFLKFQNNYFTMPSLVRTITKLTLKPSRKDINPIIERLYNSRKDTSFDE